MGGRAELIAPQAEAVGVQVHTVEVRDVMLPGELRKAFSEVLKTKQEGKAALERARGERHARKRLLPKAERKLHGRRSGNPPPCATSRTRRDSSGPAGTRNTPRFLQTLKASNAGQTFVMNDLFGPAPVPQLA